MGIKAEVEKSRPSWQSSGDDLNVGEDDEDEGEARERGGGGKQKGGLNEWVDVNVEIQGFRDDDAMPVFLAAMLSEALLADGEFTNRLWINRRFHWKLYLDVRPTFYKYLDLELI